MRSVGRAVAPVAVALALAPWIAPLRPLPSSADTGRSELGYLPALPGASIPIPEGPVLAALDPAAPSPSPSDLTAALTSVLDGGALGPSVAAAVVDLSTGTVLLERASDRVAVPASTAKILTAAAVLSLRGPQSRLATRSVDLGDGRVALVGGGDVLLGPGRGDPNAVNGRAGLDDLAEQTAQRLLAAGTATITLALDDRLFEGPAINPAWSSGDVGGGFIAPITALALDAGNVTPGTRPAPGHPFARVADPSMAAAQRFATLLETHGVRVTGPPARVSTPVPADAAVLGEVRSAPLADLVEHALTDSDNTVAEALVLLAAVSSNRPATFAGGGAAVLDRLALLGVATDGQSLPGGSGLGSGYSLAPATIVAVLELAASAEHPELRAVLTGLPVAGASGTLTDRFAAGPSAPARGLVRAKTGTLTGTSALAGTVVDADGRMLAFAVLADRVGATGTARNGLDALAATLAGCGCR